MSIRLSLLTEIPAPFRLPLFNALAAQPGVELEVVFLAERDPRRTYYPVYRDEFRFDARFLRGWSLRRGRHWLVLSWGTLCVLRRFRPDVVVIGGWNQPAVWQGALYARARRRPLVTWVESTLRDARIGSPATEALKRAVVRASSAFLVPGRAAADYVASLGAPPEDVVVAPNAIDLDIFGRRVAEARRRREDLRRELGLGACTVLYVGRLDHEKGLDVLFRAMADVPAELVVIGSGSQEAVLRSLAPPGRVRFLGSLDRDALVPWYAAADVFVLPSRSEPWGMVLNEAAAAGLPIVASTAAGAAYDLVEDGGNGFRVPPDDPGSLAAALRRLVDDNELRVRAGARSLELVAAYTPDAWASAVAGLALRLARGSRGGDSDRC